MIASPFNTVPTEFTTPFTLPKIGDPKKPLIITIEEVSQSRGVLRVRLRATKGDHGDVIDLPITRQDERRRYARRLAALVDESVEAIQERLAEASQVAFIILNERAARRTPLRLIRPDETGEEADEEVPYAVIGGRICQYRYSQSGVTVVPLANFNAWIVEEVRCDDGAEETGELLIAGTRASGQLLPAIRVPLDQFASTTWVVSNWGTAALVHAGTGTRDHLRAAIQMLSPSATRRMEYAHSGFRKIGDDWYYLHAGGAIGAIGAREDVTVRLGGPLRHISLPAPPEGETLRVAVRASLAIVGVAPARITVPMLGATYRAPLNAIQMADLAVYAAGGSGVRKSELTVLMQQHFGAGFSRLHLPGQWSDTPNALERLVFEAKDAVCVIDDFHPSGGQHEVARYHSTAERVIRGVGNGAGRGRMSATMRMRPAYPPRGFVISSGEDVPKGHSLRARMAILDVARGDVNLDRLTGAQSAGVSGRLAAAMAGYVQWIAGRWEMVAGSMHEEILRLRNAAGRYADVHSRMPETIAHLAFGWQQWLLFAEAVGAITAVERAAFWGQVWQALGVMAQQQRGHQQSEEPTQRFRDLLVAAMGAGNAHVAAITGATPSSAQSWGWRDGQFPRGERVGWVEGDHLYLQADAAHKVAEQFGTATGSGLTVTTKTLTKRLRDRGLLRSVGTGENTIRKMIEGRRIHVLHLGADFLLSDADETCPDDARLVGNDPDRDLARQDSLSGLLPGLPG